MRLFKPSFLLLTLTLGASALTAQTRVPDQAAVLAGFELQLRTDVQADDAGSIVAAVFRGSDAIWTGSFGLADRERNIEAERRHIYRVGSISKTVTAVVLMQLVERGVVALDDPVVKHLPEFSQVEGSSAQVESITLRHLASHTSGLIREPRLDNAATGPIEGWEDKVVESLGATSLFAAPGEKYSYSNIGFGALGLALSRAANRPFMEMVNTDVFGPLGFSHDMFVLNDSRWTDISVGYAPSGDGIDSAMPTAEHRGRGYKVPNGGVYNTIDELGAFAAGLGGWTDQDFLTVESRQAMRKRETPDDGTGYGLGLSISTSTDQITTYGHGGSVAGYTASMVFEPQTGFAVVILRNYNRGETNLGRITTQTLRALVRSATN
jgi:CubicO group peptidase (beta-lactamase class C family)